MSTVEIPWRQNLDEPITLEWLQQNGLDIFRTSSRIWPMVNERGDGVCLASMTDVVELPNVKTRGDVLVLCRLLGVELK